MKRSTSKDVAIRREAGRFEKGQQPDRQDRSVMCSELLSKFSGGRDGRRIGGCRLLENFLWTRVDGRLHMVAENVDMHIRCHDTGDTSTGCRIRLCAFGLWVVDQASIRVEQRTVYLLYESLYGDKEFDQF